MKYSHLPTKHDFLRFWCDLIILNINFTNCFIIMNVIYKVWIFISLVVTVCLISKRSMNRARYTCNLTTWQITNGSRHTYLKAKKWFSAIFIFFLSPTYNISVQPIQISQVNLKRFHASEINVLGSYRLCPVCHSVILSSLKL